MTIILVSGKYAVRMPCGRVMYAPRGCNAQVWAQLKIKGAK